VTAKAYRFRPQQKPCYSAWSFAKQGVKNNAAEDTAAHSRIYGIFDSDFTINSMPTWIQLPNFNSAVA
jgi:hypothetical protein